MYPIWDTPLVENLYPDLWEEGHIWQKYFSATLLTLTWLHQSPSTVNSAPESVHALSFLCTVKHLHIFLHIELKARLLVQVVRLLPNGLTENAKLGLCNFLRTSFCFGVCANG